MRWLFATLILIGACTCACGTTSSDEEDGSYTQPLTQAVFVTVPDTLEWGRPNLSHISTFSNLFSMPLDDDGNMIMLNDRKKVSWFQARMFPHAATITTEREYWHGGELQWTQVWQQEYVLWLTYEPSIWPSKVTVKRFLTDAEYVAWRGPN